MGAEWSLMQASNRGRANCGSSPHLGQKRSRGTMGLTFSEEVSKTKLIAEEVRRHAEFLVVDWEAMGAEWSLFHEPTDGECVRDLDILSYCFMRIPKRDPRP